MSKNFIKYKTYYDNGNLTKGKLKTLVGKRLGITADEYKIITGEEYEA